MPIHPYIRFVPNTIESICLFNTELTDQPCIAAPKMPETFVRRALRSSAPPETAALEGLRVLFNYAVVSGHALFFAGLMLDSPQQAMDALSDRASPYYRPFVASLRMLLYSVDVFLLISGFFLAASLCKTSDDSAATSSDGKPSHKIHLSPYDFLRHIVSRWLRLAPVLTIVSAVIALGGSPNCIGWSEVFFFRNFAKPPEASCVMPSWSTTVDMQSHIVIYLLTLLTPTWSALESILSLSIVSVGLYRTATWFSTGMPRWPFAISIIDFIPSYEERAQVARDLSMKLGNFDASTELASARREVTDRYTPLYFDTALRMAPVMLGVLTFLLMRRDAAIVRAVRKVPNLAAAAAVAVATLFTEWAGVMVQDSRGDSNVMVGAVDEGFARIVVTACVAVIVMVISSNVKGQAPRAKTLSWILGNSVMKVLSRSAYVVYVLHPITSGTIGGMWPKMTAEGYKMGPLLFKGFQWYAVTVVASIPFCFIEEAGLIGRRLFMKKIFGGRGGKQKAT